MRAWALLLAAGFLVQGGTGGAQAVKGGPVPANRQLNGLDAAQAAALLAKLDDAQRRVRAREFQPFELLSGSLASNKTTELTPRDSFLQVPFQQVWNIERVATDNSLWQPYRLSYAPNGLGQMYWEIEVVLGHDGDIQRILMIYKVPAPF